MFAQRSLLGMAPRTRSRFVRLVAFLVLVGLIREWSIRRHKADLHDWPRPGDPTQNGA